MAKAAGNSPTQEQFDQAERFVNRINGGDSDDALSMVKDLRAQPGVPWDNQLLAALDHYFYARCLHDDYGVPAGPIIILNSTYIIWKCLHLPFWTATSKPYAPPSLLQWSAGNWGAADAVERNY